ncbi:MAG: 2-oxoacid:acceptor oxidoreductase family protein [Acholeplasmatales bacterium]
MLRKITVAGFGGQGVMLLGQILAHAGNEAGLNTLWYPSYGPETRGGTANCAVTISSEQINSPTFSKATTLIIFNPPSMDKFKDRLVDDGVILYNSNMIFEKVEKKKAKIYPIPANDIAVSLGNVRVANMVMLGAYIALYSEIPKKTILYSLEELIGKRAPKLVELNIKAVLAGIKYLKDKL